ncbi:hypothetical protein ACWD5V_04730 [Streptomyces sp. NPDC002523]
MRREVGDPHVGFRAPGRSVRAQARASLLSSGEPAFTVLAFIMLGDAVRDALDPKLR